MWYLRISNVTERSIVAVRCTVELYDVFGGGCGKRSIRRDSVTIAPHAHLDIPLYALSPRVRRGMVSGRTTVFSSGEISGAYDAYSVISEAEHRAVVVHSEPVKDLGPAWMRAAGIVLIIALFGGAFALLLGIPFILL